LTKNSILKSLFVLYPTMGFFHATLKAWRSVKTTPWLISDRNILETWRVNLFFHYNDKMVHTALPIKRHGAYLTL